MLAYGNQILIVYIYKNVIKIQVCKKKYFAWDIWLRYKLKSAPLGEVFWQERVTALCLQGAAQV